MNNITTVEPTRILSKFESAIVLAYTAAELLEKDKSGSGFSKLSSFILDLDNIIPEHKLDMLLEQKDTSQPDEVYEEVVALTKKHGMEIDILDHNVSI